MSLVVILPYWTSNLYSDFTNSNSFNSKVWEIWTVEKKEELNFRWLKDPNSIFNFSNLQII